VLSIFPLNPSVVGTLTIAKLIVDEQVIITLKLIKIDKNHYVTEKFVVPGGKFKVKIEGIDAGGYKLSRLVSSDIKSVPLKLPGKALIRFNLFF
jgi:hypothetical protein